jgi:hypothetical protein
VVMAAERLLNFVHVMWRRSSLRAILSTRAGVRAVACCGCWCWFFFRLLLLLALFGAGWAHAVSACTKTINKLCQGTGAGIHRALVDGKREGSERKWSKQPSG